MREMTGNSYTVLTGNARSVVIAKLFFSWTLRSAISDMLLLMLLGFTYERDTRFIALHVCEMCACL